MDPKEILKSSYLDILYDGKNKNYGGYELRKHYSKRAMIAGLIAVLFVGGVFGAMLIKPKQTMDNFEDDMPIITEISDLKPPPPLKKNEPPPPPPPVAPPPVKPTVKFTVPEIKKDVEVVKEQKLVEAPKKGEDVGAITEKGSDDPNAVSRDLADLSRSSGPPGDGPVEADPPKKKDDEILTVVEQRAEPGYDWNGYLSKNIKYPIQARENEVTGRVTLKFVVEKDGSVSNVTVVKGKELGNGLPEEAVRALKAAPKWKPGKQGGHAVRSYMSIPVTFKLQ
ncbi:MAG TPA: TonB family protein [Edaphocola sp.]|nr:TonB family protein [Edaphocola sp.]